jgi:MOB kinase activator 1
LEHDLHLLKFYLYKFRTSKNKTFKPKKKVPEGTKQYQLKQFAEATLGSGNLKLAVVLPEGEDLNEWLAVNSKYK